MAGEEKPLNNKIACRRLTTFVSAFWVAIVVFLLSIILFPASSIAAPPQNKLVRLQFKSQDQLQAWVDSGLDVWQVDGDVALVSLPPTELQKLQAEGFLLEEVPLPTRASFPSCYRTYDDLLTFFHERAARYPQFFSWFNLGPSWEAQNGFSNRNIYAARLTTTFGPAEKPKFFLVAELHAREIVTPEVALDFIDDLLTNYGQDPAITWLLENREIWVIPMANPDGHARAVQVSDWRKNTHRTATCTNGSPPNSYGVDLNRNFGFRWGYGIGASSEPCQLTYRGDAPFSEPETQAVRQLIREQKFDLIISLHSYGDLILYPWAYTWHPAPDFENLDALAKRMAAQTGYTAIQAPLIGYTASGDLTDWTYGELGIPSFTFEVGGVEDGFFWPSGEVNQQLYHEVRPALIYAALAADKPYEVAGGPEAQQIAVAREGTQIVVRAQVSDRWSGRDRIAAAELFVASLGESDTGIPLQPVDGQCNSESEWMNVRLDQNALLDYAGQRVPIIVVSQQEDGRRGVPSFAWLDLRDVPVPPEQGVKLWFSNTSVPTFEIQGEYVYAGPAEQGHVVLTVHEGHVYRGMGTTGELLYTIRDGQVVVGEAGPVVYSRIENEIYQGLPNPQALLYHIESTRLLVGRNNGHTNPVILTANVDLASRVPETIPLLLPLLIDGRF